MELTTWSPVLLYDKTTKMTLYRQSSCASLTSVCADLQGLTNDNRHSPARIGFPATSTNFISSFEHVTALATTTTVIKREFCLQMRGTHDSINLLPTSKNSGSPTTTLNLYTLLQIPNCTHLHHCLIAAALSSR